MTKKIVYCPICTKELGSFHGHQQDEVISDHIIFAHSQVAKHIVEIALKIEEYQVEFKSLSGMYSRDALHNFLNQNTMRKLGWTEKEINKHLSN